MVLSELSSRLTGALRTMGQSPKVDEQAMEACLKEITKALLEVRATPSAALASRLPVAASPRVKARASPRPTSPHPAAPRSRT